MNRIVRWIAKGLEYEAGPRQSEKLVRELGLEGAKGVTTPAVKATIEQIHKDQPIEEKKVTHFRDDDEEGMPDAPQTPPPAVVRGGRDRGGRQRATPPSSGGLSARAIAGAESACAVMNAFTSWPFWTAGLAIIS